MNAISRFGVTHAGTLLSASVRIFGGAACACEATTIDIATIARRTTPMHEDEIRPFAVNGVTMALSNSLRGRLLGARLV
jgi:hypothetical protein